MSSCTVTMTAITIRITITVKRMNNTNNDDNNLVVALNGIEFAISLKIINDCRRRRRRRRCYKQ